MTLLLLLLYDSTAVYCPADGRLLYCRFSAATPYASTGGLPYWAAIWLAYCFTASTDSIAFYWHRLLLTSASSASNGSTGAATAATSDADFRLLPQGFFYCLYCLTAVYWPRLPYCLYCFYCFDGLLRPRQLYASNCVD
uniref:Uncharacterized protein n=1 Tax=Knipowitschia caucasica TaxID=637954 RepID=A0AAV2J204_KNICA